MAVGTLSMRLDWNVVHAVVLEQIRAGIADDRAEEARAIKAVTGLDTPPGRHPIGVVLDAYQAVRTAEREACCRDICPHCREGYPLALGDRSRHVMQGGIQVTCAALFIRARTP